MPRRFRPPTRRRKSKTQYADEAPGAAAPGASPVSPPAAPKPAPVASERAGAPIVRHIARDHAYVLGEIRLIALLVAFILGGLIITAIIR